MTTQLIAILAAAGLTTAGVAAASETRSAAAIPVASMVGVAKPAKNVASAPVARQGSGVDCALESNSEDPACAPLAGKAAGSRGVSGGVLGAIAAGLGVAGIVVAAKNDSNG